MAHRAFWKGQIRLALVSIPVEVFTATNSSAAIRFRQIHEPSGKPVRYEKVVPGIGPVDTDEILKGYQMSKEEYVLLDNDEIESRSMFSTMRSRISWRPPTALPMRPMLYSGIR